MLLNTNLTNNTPDHYEMNQPQPSQHQRQQQQYHLQQRRLKQQQRQKQRQQQLQLQQQQQQKQQLQQHQKQERLIQHEQQQQIQRYDNFQDHNLQQITSTPVSLTRKSSCEGTQSVSSSNSSRSSLGKRILKSSSNPLVTPSHDEKSYNIDSRNRNTPNASGMLSMENNSKVRRISDSSDTRIRANNPTSDVHLNSSNCGEFTMNTDLNFPAENSNYPSTDNLINASCIASDDDSPLAEYTQRDLTNGQCVDSHISETENSHRGSVNGDSFIRSSVERNNISDFNSNDDILVHRVESPTEMKSECIGEIRFCESKVYLDSQPTSPSNLHSDDQIVATPSLDCHNTIDDNNIESGQSTTPLHIKCEVQSDSSEHLNQISPSNTPGDEFNNLVETLPLLQDASKHDKVSGKLNRLLDSYMQNSLLSKRSLLYDLKLKEHKLRQLGIDPNSIDNDY